MRPRGVPIKTITQTQLAVGRAAYPEAARLSRPKTRCDCIHGTRPCPWVGCRYNLLLDINVNTGGFKITWPDKRAREIGESCALDVADRGGVTLEEVGGMMNVTRERIRQIQDRAMEKLSRKPMAKKMKEYMDE